MSANKKTLKHLDATDDGQKSEEVTPAGGEAASRGDGEVVGGRRDGVERGSASEGVPAADEAVGKACEWPSTRKTSQKQGKPQVTFSRLVVNRLVEMVEGPGTRNRRRVATGEAIGTTTGVLARPNMEKPREPEELGQERIREILGAFHGAPPVDAPKPTHCRKSCGKGPCFPETCSCVLGEIRCSVDARCQCGPINCANCDIINPRRDVVKANEEWREMPLPDENDTIRSVDPPVADDDELEMGRSGGEDSQMDELADSFADLTTTFEEKEEPVEEEKADRSIGKDQEAVDEGAAVEPEVFDRFVTRRRRRNVEEVPGSDVQGEPVASEEGQQQQVPNNVQQRPSDVLHYLCYICGTFFGTLREHQHHVLYHELMKLAHHIKRIEPTFQLDVTSSFDDAHRLLHVPYINIRRRAAKRMATESRALDEPEMKRRSLDDGSFVDVERCSTDDSVSTVSIDEADLVEIAEEQSTLHALIDQEMEVQHLDDRFVTKRRKGRMVDESADTLEHPRFVSNLGERISMNGLEVDQMPFDDSIPDQLVYEGLDDASDAYGVDSGAEYDGEGAMRDEEDDEEDETAPTQHRINLDEDRMGSEFKKMLPNMLNDSDYESCSKDKCLSANALFCGMMQVASAPNRNGLKIGVLSPMVMKEWDMGMTMTKAEIDENLFNLDPQQVLIPIYQPSRMYEDEMIEHWMVALYDVRGCSITIYDTIESTNDEKEVVIGLVNALMDEWIGEDESNCLRNRFARRDRVEKQTGIMNKANSGIFALLHARRLVQSEKDVSSRGRAPVDVERERSQILETMKAAAVDFEKLKQPATSTGTLQNQQQQQNQRKRKLQAVTTPDYVKARRDNTETREKIRRCYREMKKRC